MIASNSSDIGALRTQLDALLGHGSPVVDEAIRRLLSAAEAYQMSRPIVDSKNRRSRTSLSDARAALAKLAKQLDSLLETYTNLPINAKVALAESSGGPTGKFANESRKFAAATAEALAALKAAPNKKPDEYRALLALDVALVFRDVLAITPAATRDMAATVTGERGGAGYARVLRATFKLAGVPQVDLGPLIDRGLQLLDDKDLPHNRPQ